MKALEIILLRMAAGNPQSLVDSIYKSLGSGADSESISIYRRVGLQTDLAIHIHSNKKSRTPGPSELGLRLASELKVYGLVEHAHWEKMP